MTNTLIPDVGSENMTPAEVVAGPPGSTICDVVTAPSTGMVMSTSGMAVLPGAVRGTVGDCSARRRDPLV